MQVLSVSGNDSLLIDGYKFYDNQVGSKINHNLKGWVFSDIMKSLYRNIEHWTNERYKEVSSYKKNKDIQLGDNIAYVDVDHCYLQVARNLGYLGQSDYERILKKYSDIKIEVCASFTSLFKDVKCTYFKGNGKIDREIECFNYELELIRDNIINYSNGIMESFTGEYYYRNVDGIIIPESEVESLLSHLAERNLKFKIFKGMYLGNKSIYCKEKDIIHTL